MENKLVSIIMPTFNSEKTIRLSLESIKKQNFDINLVEILVVDGGSTDKTIEIANEFNCRVIPNPRVQPEFAKYEGIINAYGKYAVFLDSDEIFSNIDALKNRIEIFEKENIKLIFTGGYIKPKGANFINDYINNFSDPFSYFMYNSSSDYRYYFDIMAKKYNSNIFEKYAILNFANNDIVPLSDLCAGNSINLEYVRNNIILDNKDVNIIIELISLIIEKEKMWAILKDDYILHYSSDSFKKYLKKIKWRIVNNLFYKESAAGFINKERFNSEFFNIKKYLFIPYSLTFILPFLVGFYFSIIRANFVLIIHGFLTFYTGALICYYYLLKILKIKPKLMNYGK